jgi:hypothetical protein
LILDQDLWTLTCLFSRSYNGPYRNSPEHKGSSQRNCSRNPDNYSPGMDFEDESHSKYVSDMGRAKNLLESTEDSEVRMSKGEESDVYLHFWHLADDSRRISTTPRRLAVRGG